VCYWLRLFGCLGLCCLLCCVCGAWLFGCLGCSVFGAWSGYPCFLQQRGLAVRLSWLVLLLSRRRPKGGKVWQRPKAADDPRVAEGLPLTCAGPTFDHGDRHAAQPLLGPVATAACCFGQLQRRVQAVSRILLGLLAQARHGRCRDCSLG
jgi:hypothetical protein